MPAVQVFSDFDGTICLKDTGNLLIDAGMGIETRQALDAKVLRREMTFLEATIISWEAVNMTFEEGLALLRDAELDPGFLEFHRYVTAQQIPFAIVSCGLDILIQEYMRWHLGEAQARDLEILANHGVVDDRKWLVTFRDDSPHAHDKSRCIRAARAAFEEAQLARRQLQKQQQVEQQLAHLAHQHPHQHDHQVIVFCGDGISDLSAAREADVLLARRGLELESYCREHKLPFLPFDSFEEVHEIVQGLHENKISLEEIKKRQQAACEAQ